SKGNYVAVRDPAPEMFGKIMSIPDDLMLNYFKLLTPIPEARVQSLINPTETHPRQAKDVLGRTIVESFYGSTAAHHASDEFRRRFAEGQLPENIETVSIPEATLGVLKLV